MGIAKMQFNFNLNTLGGVDTKLLAATISQLPNGTKFVGMESGYVYSADSLLFEHPLFKEGAALMGEYRRDVAVVDNKVIEVDHFVGLNLKDVLIDENEEMNNEQ